MAAATNIAEAGGTARGQWLAGLRDWLAASDPALSRLRLASRALLSVLLAGGLLAGFAAVVHPLPIAAYGLAVVIAFIGGMAVRDATGREQALTRLYGFVVATAAVFAASVLAPIPLGADLAFLAVIFVAVYIRALGQRWFVIGMIAVMSYFMGDYIRPQPADIGWLALAGAVAFAVTHVVTNLLLRDDPERDFRRALGTIDRRISLILRVLLDLSARRANATGDRRLQEHVSQLREIVLMAEGFIPQGEEGSLAARGAASDLAVALFDLQLVVERLVRASAAAVPPAGLLLAAIDRDEAALRAAGEAAGTSDEAVAARLLLRTDRSRTRLDAVLGERPSPAFAATEDRPQPVIAATGAGGASRGPLVPVALQLPIQVTLACGIAMAGGLLLSPVRWYWAVLTAFIVFNNMKSRADAAQRALQRSLGTFAGLFGGILIATLLSGQMLVSAIAIPVLFFLAFYFLQVSYGLMIFLITVALALIYGLLGSFTPELLLLRLEETLLGSIAATAVAFLVFPARASLNAGTALDMYLQRLGELVAAARGRAHGEPEPLHLLARSRLLDRAYTDLANAVRPLGGPWGAVTRFGGVRERLLLLTGGAHWGRVLARGVKPGEALPAETLGRIDVLAEELAGRIAAARAVKDIFFERPEADEAAASTGRRPSLPLRDDDDPVLALEVISALLGRATPAGAASP